MKFNIFNKENNEEREKAINERKKEADARKDSAVTILKAMYEMTGASVLKFKISCVELNDLLTDLSFSMHTVTPSQYDELVNIVSQFKEVIEDYIKENNVIIKE